MSADGPCDVLVVGAGPTGLCLAIECARRGLAVRVVDGSTREFSDPRAVVVKPSTLHVAALAGVRAEVVAESVATHAVSFVHEGRCELVISTGADDLPWYVNLGENVLVDILERRLADLGVSVEWSAGVEALEARADGATVTIGAAAGAFQVDAGFVVGCDGARSTIRRLAGVDFPGEDSPWHWHTLDVQIAGWPWDRSHDVNICDPWIVAVHHLRDGFRLYFLSDGPLEDPFGHVCAYLEAQVPGVKLAAPTGGGAFQVHHRVATRFRTERVLLAGDAAHVMSPTSAAGLNCGLQDAVNLGWKLAAVLGGQADDSLLDSYELERRPPAEKCLAGGRAGDERFQIRDDTARRKALREWAVATDAYRRSGGMGFEDVMGDYAGSPAVCSADEAGGIAPGSCAPLDAFVWPARPQAQPEANQERNDLVSALSSPLHTLLVCARGGQEEADDLIAHARSFAREHDDAFELRVLTAERDPNEGTASGDQVWVDRDMGVHNRLGVVVPTVFWMRPDTRVGGRWDSATVSSMREDIGRVLLRR